MDSDWRAYVSVTEVAFHLNSARRQGFGVQAKGCAPWKHKSQRAWLLGCMIHKQRDASAGLWSPSVTVTRCTGEARCL